MLWLIWRQHRLQLLVAGVLLFLLGLLCLSSGLNLRSVYQDSGVDACLTPTAPPTDTDCAQIVQNFASAYTHYSSEIPWLNLLPALLGIFIGAPLVARELEQGMHHFVWTQGVTRLRWLVYKMSVLLLATILCATIFTVLFSWWRAPFDRIASDTAGSSFSPGIAFDFEGIVPVAYSIYALLLGVAMGTIFGKTVIAMALTLLGFVVPRIVILNAVRPHFMEPLVSTYAAGQPNPRMYQGDWLLAVTPLDSLGNGVDGHLVRQWCGQYFTLGKEYAACVQSHGLHYRQTYQSADRFWIFQGSESLMYAGLAASCLGVTGWWLRRRIT